MVEEKNWLEMTSEGSNYTLEDEGTENYRTGGYRAVRIRDTFSQSKPGWGHLSAVWLAWDTLRSVLTPLSLSVWISHSCWLKTLEKLEIWEWMLSTQQSVEGQLTNFVEWNKKMHWACLISFSTIEVILQDLVDLRYELQALADRILVHWIVWRRFFLSFFLFLNHELVKSLFIFWGWWVWIFLVHSSVLLNPGVAPWVSLFNNITAQEIHCL